jgi:hypothetical protein
VTSSRLLDEKGQVKDSECSGKLLDERGQIKYGYCSDKHLYTYLLFLII